MNRVPASTGAAPTKRLAVVWRNFGPYHYARLRALDAHFLATGIQIVGATDKHRWTVDAGGERVITLFPDDAGASPAAVCRRLWAALDKVDPDVLLIPSYSPYPAWVCLVWGILHRRTRIIMTESNAFDAPRSAPGETIKRILLKFYHGAMVGGSTAGEYLVQLGFPAKKIRRGYDCVDVETFATLAEVARKDAAATRSRLQLPERFFVCPARLVAEKNHSRLLEAFADFQGMPGNSDMHLLLCGTGHLEATLRAKIARENIQNIELRGFVQMEDMAALYALCIAMILPSLIEAWGLVVNEALACGAFVLVSNRAGAGFDLVLPGRTGLRFDPISSEELVMTMTTATEYFSNCDDSRHEEILSVARRFSPEFFGRNVAECVSLFSKESGN